MTGVEKTLSKSIQFGWHWFATRSMSHDKMTKLSSLISPQSTNVPLVRLGGANDGGYLLPDDLDDISACFSPGVGYAADFEAAMLEREIPCFLADASVDKAPLQHENIHFDRLFLGGKTEGDTISLEDWVNRYTQDKSDLVLQMDIEGAEYEVLAAASIETLSRFRIVVVEFHRSHLMLTKAGCHRLTTALEKLHEVFLPVHLHLNNARPFVEFNGYVVPRAFETTFLRRDRVEKFAPVETLPNPLDQANVLTRPNPEVPKWMYGSSCRVS